MFRATRQLAISLAGDIAAGFPPSLQQLSGRKALEMFKRTTDQLQVKVKTVQQEQRMGLIRRVVFARTLQNELTRLGYEGALVRQIMSQVLTALTF